MDPFRFRVPANRVGRGADVVRSALETEIHTNGVARMHTHLQVGFETLLSEYPQQSAAKS